MNKILITAFEPFNNNDTNYSKEILNEIIDSNKILKATFEVSYYNSFLSLKKIINKFKPNIIILMGEARKNELLAFETIGLNETNLVKDINNLIPNLKLIDNNINYLNATLNFQVFKNAFKEVNVNFIKSNDAGKYVCNAILYQTLLFIKENKLNIECGFIHIPNIIKQSKKDILLGLNNYINKLLTGGN